MLKADKLREAIAHNYPDLARDPERLRIFTEKAKVRPINGASLHFMIEYDLQLAILDLNTSVLGVFAVINDWLRRNQPELCASQASAGYDFEAAIATNSTADLLLTFALTETIITARDADGKWHMEQLEEPTDELADFLGDADLMDDQPVPLLKEIWHGGEKLLPEADHTDG
jgi:hypothetical protein